jgi:nitroreductase
MSKYEKRTKVTKKMNNKFSENMLFHCITINYYMEISKEFVQDLIKNRRSVYPKDFTPGIKIEDKVVEDILDLAVWAPTHKLTQPWYFKVYRNEGVKRFFEKQAEIYKEITPAEIFSEKKIEKYALKADQVSHVIAIISQHHPENKIPEIEETVATACALQNIYLSLKVYGIAGYLSTGKSCYTEQMSEFLQLKKGDKCLGFFQLGVSIDELKSFNRKRISAMEKMEWIG